MRHQETRGRRGAPCPGQRPFDPALSFFGHRYFTYRITNPPGQFPKLSRRVLDLFGPEMPPTPIGEELESALATSSTLNKRFCSEQFYLARSLLVEPSGVGSPPKCSLLLR